MTVGIAWNLPVAAAFGKIGLKTDSSLMPHEAPARAHAFERQLRQRFATVLKGTGFFSLRYRKALPIELKREVHPELCAKFFTFNGTDSLCRSSRVYSQGNSSGGHLMSAFLVPLDPGLCLIPLEKAIVLIGRQSDCDVSLTHSRKVSRKHCCIAQVNSSFVIRDLGSTNGVFVNGSRVRKEAGLTLGDELAIGDVRFRLQTEAMAAKSAKVQVDDKRPTPLPPPSMDIPVAIPEIGSDFVVEHSIAQMRPIKHRKPNDMPLAEFEPEGDVIPLASDSF